MCVFLYLTFSDTWHNFHVCPCRSSRKHFLLRWHPGNRHHVQVEHLNASHSVLSLSFVMSFEILSLYRPILEILCICWNLHWTKGSSLTNPSNFTTKANDFILINNTCVNMAITVMCRAHKAGRAVCGEHRLCAYSDLWLYNSLEIWLDWSPQTAWEELCNQPVLRVWSARLEKRSHNSSIKGAN